MPEVSTETPQTPAPPAPAPVPGETDGYEFGSFLDNPDNSIPEDGDRPGPLADLSTAEEPSSETVETDEFPPTHASFKGIRPEIVALMKHVAGKGEYDLNNPREFKAARQIAEKEARIRELSKAGEPSPAATDYLDAFRDKDLEPPAGQPAPAAQPPAQTAAEALPDFVEIARKWKSPSDFTPDLLDAFEMVDGPEKNAAVANRFLGLNDRQFHETQVPYIAQMINHFLEQRLGPVVHEVTEARQMSERRSVVDTLAKQEGLSDVHELFELVTDGTLEFKDPKTGELSMVPDSWLNRALIENPDILKWVVKGRNDAETDRLSLAARYRAAHREMTRMRKGSIDPAAARTLVATGKAIEKSKRDPVRTELNAGKPGVQTGTRKESLFGHSDGEVKMSDLWL